MKELHYQSARELTAFDTMDDAIRAGMNRCYHRPSDARAVITSVRWSSRSLWLSLDTGEVVSVVSSDDGDTAYEFSSQCATLFDATSDRDLVTLIASNGRSGIWDRGQIADDLVARRFIAVTKVDHCTALYASDRPTLFCSTLLDRRSGGLVLYWEYETEPKDWNSGAW